MDNSDIRQNILLFINDIETLSHLCSVDKLFYGILSNKVFWNLKINNDNLPNISDRFNGACSIKQKSNMAFTRPTSWFTYYNKEKQLQIYTDRLMEILEHPKTEDFKDVVDVDEDDFYLVIHMSDIYLPMILDVEGINLEEIMALSDKHVTCQLNDELRKRSMGACNFWIDDNQVYIVDVNYYYFSNFINYRYHINRDNIRKIFYKMLSYGVIPRDGSNEDHVIL
jgi:hypothetical protein